MHGLAADLLDVRHTVYSLAQNWSTPMPPVGQFFSFFLLVVLVAVLAYYTTRLIGGSAKFGRGAKRNLELLESMGVGTQSYVHILRVGEQYILVGVTRGQVSLLTQLSADQLQLPEGGQGVGFDSILSRFQKKQDPPDDGKDN